MIRLVCVSLILQHLLCISIARSAQNSESSPTIVEKLGTKPWISVQSNSQNINSYQDAVGIAQLHVGLKPFFHTIVPSPQELQRSFFNLVTAHITLDWESLKVRPENKALHQSELIRIREDFEVAIDILPVMEQGMQRSYAIATFLRNNFPVYLIHTKIDDRTTFIEYLKNITFSGIPNLGDI